MSTVAGAALQARLEDIHRALCKALYYQDSVKPRPLAWLAPLGPDRYQDFQDCCMNPDLDFAVLAARLGISEDCAEREQVLALRGLIGMRVLEHTLQRRHRVDFGLTERCGRFHQLRFKSCAAMHACRCARGSCVCMILRRSPLPWPCTLGLLAV